MLFNPALLARGSDDERRINARPYVGARLIDRDEFLDSLDAFQESTSDERLRQQFGQFERRVDAGIEEIEDAREALAEARDVIGAARALLDDYETLSDKPLRVGASAGGSLGYSGNDYAMGMLLRRSEMGGTVIRLTDEDLTSIEQVFTTVDSLARGVELFIDDQDQLPLITALLKAIVNNTRIPEEEDLTSSLAFEGARVTETAVAYTPATGDKFSWRWGATFKLIEFETIDYEERIAEADAVDFSDNRHKLRYSDINLDVGVTRRIDRHWRFGAVVRNAVPRGYNTVRGNTIELRPLLRVGVAYEPQAWTLTADLDITTSDPLGFDPDKRYLSTGVEWRAWRNTALRAGYRYNTVSGSGLYSLGIGLGPHRTHFDLALAYKGDELGISLQLAAYF